MNDETPLTAYYTLEFKLEEYLGKPGNRSGLGKARIDKTENSYRIVFSAFLFADDNQDECAHANTIGGFAQSFAQDTLLTLELLTHPELGDLRLSESSPKATGREYKYLIQKSVMGIDGLPQQLVWGIHREGKIKGTVTFNRLS